MTLPSPRLLRQTSQTSSLLRCVPEHYTTHLLPVQDPRPKGAKAQLENYNVPHKPLYHLCLTALAALQKLVFEPQSTVYDESLMTKKDTELSAAERASKETLCRTGALIAAIADR
jgi:hypothetical protein